MSRWSRLPGAAESSHGMTEPSRNAASASLSASASLLTGPPPPPPTLSGAIPPLRLLRLTGTVTVTVMVSVSSGRRRVAPVGTTVVPAAAGASRVRRASLRPSPQSRKPLLLAAPPDPLAGTIAQGEIEEGKGMLLLPVGLAGGSPSRSVVRIPTSESRSSCNSLRASSGAKPEAGAPAVATPGWMTRTHGVDLRLAGVRQIADAVRPAPACEHPHAPSRAPFLDKQVRNSPHLLFKEASEDCSSLWNHRPRATQKCRRNAQARKGRGPPPSRNAAAATGLPAPDAN